MRTIVRNGYELADYQGAYRVSAELSPFERRFVGGLAAMLAPGAEILDWGCGPGVPYDLHLAWSGFRLTGVDICAKHIAAAKRNVPAAAFIEGDFTSHQPPGPVDALVCLYALFHVPREEHSALLARAYRLVKPGGFLLITVGVHRTAGVEIERGWCGATMAWSSFDAETNLRMIAGAGFGVVLSADEADWGSNEHQLWVLAERRGAVP
ncbi:MAG: class I SAM-dependent methyltransferase [Bacillota bacterium]|nr:class I SAM-dependent methyltransferase [Bacillota bacterium]